MNHLTPFYFPIKFVWQLKTPVPPTLPAASGFDSFLVLSTAL